MECRHASRDSVRYGRVVAIAACVALILHSAERAEAGQRGGGGHASGGTGRTSGGTTGGTTEGSGGAGYCPQPLILIGASPYPYPFPPYPTFVPVPVPTPSMGGGLMLPTPAAPAAAPVRQPAARPVATRRPDPNRSAELITLGDRLFRASNLKKSEERYNQAAKADPNAAAPHVRLAQLALVRGRFDRAAELFRLAQTIEPDWVFHAPDIQSVYAEPTDFAKVIEKLETQVQAHPDDRDAWLTLGAQLFLSGRVQRARDIFQRLNDRKPDETLAAFLDASVPRPTEPAPPSSK